MGHCVCDCSWRGGTKQGAWGFRGFPLTGSPSSSARAPHTQPFEVSGSDLADAVEAGVQVSGCLGKRRDALQVGIVTVHRGTKAHADQTGGQVWPRWKTEQRETLLSPPLASGTKGPHPGSV